ncbi:MAG: ABC transporter ATP-binding protein [Actinobacteria bacterium]|nr:ABC transporter ATP-binding protein [Actinomycetota bacterium]
MSLRVRDLGVEVRHRGVWIPAVTGVSFDVEPGQMVGLAGESGSGKSLTGLAIMGLLNSTARRSSGSIELDGERLTAAAGGGRPAGAGTGLAMVFQNPMTSLNPSLPIGRQIAEAVQLHEPGVGAGQAADRARELLGLVEIRDAAHAAAKYPHEFSGGMQQRAMIAMAVACGPKVLIADEPTTALDVTVQRSVMDLLARLQRQLGLAVLLVSHDLALIAERCDQVLVMYAGELVEVGPAARVVAEPEHPYVAGLIRAMPDRALESGALEPLEGRVPRVGESAPTECRFAGRCEFAVDACRRGHPVMSIVGERALVRCVRAGSLALGSPAPSAEEAPVPDASGGPPPDGNILEAAGLTRRFAAPVGRGAKRIVVAVNEVSIAVGDGESLGLVGESGSGKSTLGKMICGLTRPDSGRVSLRGRDVLAAKASSDELWRTVQLVFQDPYSSLNPRMKVGQILAEPLKLWLGVSRREVDGRVAELLDSVGLDQRFAAAFPGTLSGGQRQRVSIARALAGDPRLIVFDEAVSSLDVSVQAQILALLNRLRAERGLSYLFISHDIGVVRLVCDRVAVMRNGEIVETCAAGDLVPGSTHQPYTERLLSAVPRMPARA